MDQLRVKEILKKIKSSKIAVYGDFCVDAYWIMDSRGSEVSIETGLQAESVGSHYYSPGGAANIVANLSALHPAKIEAIAVVGDDIYGRELTAQLKGLHADTSSLVIQKENFNTYTYLKKYRGDIEDPRNDFGVYNVRSEATDKQILANIREALTECDVMIFNQQVPGSLRNRFFIDEANKIFKAYDDKIIIVDSRHYNDQFKNIYRKTNDIEIAALCGESVNPSESIPYSDIKKYGTLEFSRTGKPVIVTCGSRGVLVFDEEGIHEIPGIQLTSKLDTVGAGDTGISAVALCLAAGLSPSESAAFGNYASAVTVQKLFTTGTANAEEILEISRDPNFVYQADLAENIRGASYLPDTEIELCDLTAMNQLGDIKHAVFDHDGTISTLRQGWEEIMEPVMIKAILGNKYNSVDQAGYNEVVKQVKEYINKTTGIQTIFQMEGLVKMVDEFGYVPKHEILDKFEYKRIYNEALMEMVNKRLRKLKAGELDVFDFMLKGAFKFLTELKKRGVTMYLASGTDVEDVINEASLLGYADMFDGGIYGAMRDVTKFSKKMIMEKIIRENKLKGNELAVFGDGPVEIRACRRFDGIATGITSNEIRRYGMDVEKRSRLVKAGAHFLISDFSQYQKLTNLLFEEK
ncbi:MAG: PfkB family carbohydrate kinase [Cytophagales bacterium]|nr:PfkB family carbohydrate kinase [Cytophagales bacterium]